MGKGVIYSDEACKLLTDWLEENGYEYEQGNMNAECVEFSVKIGNYSILVWFSTERQVFGFNMLQGGSKTSSKFDGFKSSFEVYIKIYTEIIPNAKKVADVYEKFIGESTIFNKFVGNSMSGFTVLFNIVGKDRQGLRIKCLSSSIYRVDYVEYESSKSYRVLQSDDYVINGDTAERVLAEVSLEDLAKESENASYDEETGLLTFKDSVNTLVFEKTEEGIFLRDSNSKLLFTKGVRLESTTLGNLVSEAIETSCWDYIPLYAEIKDYLTEDEDLCVDDKQYILSSEGKNLVILDGSKRIKVSNVGELELFIQSKMPVKPIETLEEEVEEQEEEPEELVEDVEEEEEMLKGSDEEMRVMLLVDEGETIAVRFVGKTISDVPVELAEANGLPIKRIRAKSEVFEKHGLAVTQEELDMKMFSESIEDAKKVKGLIASLFN